MKYMLMMNTPGGGPYQVIRWAEQDFKAHIAFMMGFAQKLLSIALRRFARMQSHLVLLGRLSANEKIASFLCDLLDRQDSDDVVHLPMQRADIADYLGLTFETVSRVLRVLKDRGIVRVDSVDRIDVVDYDALRSLTD